jgi:hypothetical protein
MLARYLSTLTGVSQWSLSDTLQVNNTYYFGLSSTYGPGLSPINNYFQMFKLEINKNCTAFDSVNTAVCVACAVGYYRPDKNPGTGCILPEHALPGYGPNIIENLYVPCNAGVGCLACRTNFVVCQQCDISNGYYLDKSTMKCYSIATKILFEIKPNILKGKNTHMAVVLNKVSPAGQDLQGVISYIIAMYPPNINLYMKGDSSVGVTTPYTSKRYARQQSMYIDLTFKEIPNALPVEGNYSYGPDITRFFFNNTWFEILQSNNVTWYESNMNPAAAESASKIGEVVGAASTFSSADRWYTSGVVGVLLALDPSGMLFRFTKLLQICNKLYYFNVQYGSALDTFLWKISSSPENNDPPLSDAYGVKDNRGKLTFRRVPLSMVDSIKYMISIYLASWVILLIRWLAMRHTLLSSFALMTCYHYDKVHNVLFSVFFANIIWLAPRLAFHYRLVPLSKFIWGYLAIILTVVDIARLVYAVINPTIWRRYLTIANYPDGYLTPIENGKMIPTQRTKLLMQSKAQTGSALDQSTTGLVGEDKSHLDNSSAQSNQKIMQDGIMPYRDPKTLRLYAGKFPSPLTMTRKHNGEFLNPIDYNKTYEEIYLNRSMLRIQTWTTRRHLESFGSRAVRFLSLNLWMRLVMYELTISSTQYCTTVGLLFMLFWELISLGVGGFALVKYKYTKNVICLLLEILTPIWMTIFLIIALIIHTTTPEDAEPSLALQVIGMYTIIIAIITEYLLLLTQLGYWLYRFWHRRDVKFTKTPNGVDIPAGDAPVIYYQDIDRLYRPDRHPQVDDIYAVVGMEHIPKHGVSLAITPQAAMLKKNLRIDIPDVDDNNKQNEGDNPLGFGIDQIIQGVGVYASHVMNNPAAKNTVVRLEPEPVLQNEIRQINISAMNISQNPQEDLASSNSYSSIRNSGSAFDSMGVPPPVSSPSQRDLPINQLPAENRHSLTAGALSNTLSANQKPSSAN